MSTSAKTLPSKPTDNDMIFEDVAGQCVCRLPVNWANERIPVDGEIYYNLRDASERWGIDIKKLRSSWLEKMYATTSLSTSSAIPTDSCIDPTYYPYLATDWYPADALGCRSKETHTFDIRTGRTGGGPVIFTITVNPSFNAESAKNIARLLSYSPGLWQALRDHSRQLLENIEGYEDFAKVVELLWLACDQFPYAWPETHSDESTILARNNLDAIEKLITAKGGK